MQGAGRSTAADRLVVDASTACAIRARCSGAMLGLELVVVSISETVFQTLAIASRERTLEFQGVVAAPFSSALAALEDDEMDLGCICVDMGGGSTSVAVFSNGALVHRGQPGGPAART